MIKFNKINNIIGQKIANIKASFKKINLSKLKGSFSFLPELSDITRLGALKKDIAPEDITLSISLLPQAIVLSEINSKLELLRHDYVEYEPKKLLPTLTQLVDAHQIEGRPCRLVLSPQQYQLIMTDAPNVLEHEMKLALRWKVKELLDYPLDNAALDLFHVPPYGLNRQNKKVFAVAAQITWLREMAEIFQEAFLPIQVIDIADLAIRNIMTFYAQGKYTETSTAFLSLDKTSGKLIIMNNENIYLIRQLPVNRLPGTAEESAFSQAVLAEIQRSFNYCQDELRIDPPKQLLFSPGMASFKYLEEYLHNQLHIDLNVIDFNQILLTTRPLEKEFQQNGLYALGASMSGWLHGHTQAE